MQANATENRCPTPDSRCPTPGSRCPTPDSRCPTPAPVFFQPKKKPALGRLKSNSLGELEETGASSHPHRHSATLFPA
ncbi:hypothetical protein FCL38_07325 [Pseudoduganella umbonata]|uniref:Uncharacterized protein n=1 Tax=Pseudoduganella umbonata TaxID=864828 RepID=A0ABX5UER4_9BURK|nr:hypothetical protein FCL38_07325 [Pseudoduganella umbonata]